MAALLAGQSFSEVARAFSIPIGTLKSWKQRDVAGLDASRESPDASAKRSRIGELLLDYLVTTLETLKAQQVVFRDTEWLKQQSAGELAVLHGVSVDKAVRLLEGLADEGASAGAS